MLEIMGTNKMLAPGLTIEKKGAQVSVSFPKSHPKAEKFLALEQELATRKTTPGGIEYDTGPNQGNVDKVMTLLADIVDTQLLKDELTRQQAENTLKAFNKQIATFTDNPFTMPKALLGTNYAKMLDFDATTQQKIENVIKDKEPKWEPPKEETPEEKDPELILPDKLKDAELQ
jgi:hypothetical protein